MSEDEFVVLLEHAGILETSDENDMEFMEETVLREWLERDGVELFTTQMTTAKREQRDVELVVEGSASAAPTATVTATTLVGEARTRMAGHILARLLERGWIAPIEFDYDEDETEEWKTKLYTPRLRTTEAYRIYIEKDPGVADNDQKSRLREKMWQDCFPTCSESAKQTFLSFNRPEIILYATLGLNLISNGISSVPAFSRELKSMGVSSADDRSVIVGFLAKAFPCE
ncbi:hypothetical protein BBO99_00000483 [Phytophthora kernoviae]|uniref:Uncharacterized protein n=2 Tax=Phytophthora kernoviae TaxID=325452 RepID=A0A3R7K429_9STRA|nr:hypothetical protein G195_003180 [Phytophthora kernoviae 00238/432]KAG2526906.1 hypothetical protein JM18_004078 [Phytophthora kernoviae]KAG2529014.1 hypothetical protein JM16_002331 [Phytophthora kernoviae]RLN32171.1 hypothetical protein BBI17_001655 [Phytophthora kernoviae]RLN85585.1 hypothetical protein BBO99_00000483 [Phytophthora kernoviae]